MKRGQADRPPPALVSTGSLLLAQNHVHTLSAAIKHHGTIRQGEEGVVPTTPDVPTCVILRAMLTHNDATGRHVLPAVGLDAQALSWRVPTVPTAPLTLLMSHAATPGGHR
jgi:hypothetical protein